MLRAGSDGRVCRSPVIELREERARISRERGRRGGGSWATGGPASGRPKCEEKRWKGFLVCERGVEASCTRCSGSGTLSCSAWDGRPSSEGAHDAGRALRGWRGSEAPVECAWPMVRGRPARKARLEKKSRVEGGRWTWSPKGSWSAWRRSRRQAAMDGAAEPSRFVTALARSRQRRRLLFPALHCSCPAHGLLLGLPSSMFATQQRGDAASTHSLREKQYRHKKGPARDRHDGAPASPESSAKASDEATAPPPFPHAPARASVPHDAPAKPLEDMAKPPSRLYALHAASSSEETHALKKTHLNLVSAVLHRCLLDRDYERAGRAWGIILRTQVAGGHAVDPRNHGRWGVGAEILLRRQPLRSQNAPHHNPSRSPGRDLFSDQGFELAREYYERMIVQHPNRRTHPHAVDDKSFYPAMFSLWIFETCEKSKRAWKRTPDPSPPSATNLDDGHAVDGIRPEEDTTLVEELAGAMQIADRLDRLIASPPFDKEASLLQLRGNVSLWIGNLVIGNDSFEEDWDMDSIIKIGEQTSQTVAEQLICLTNCHRELRQAQNFFQRATANGAKGQGRLLSSIDIRLKELVQQLEKWRVLHQGHSNTFLAPDHYATGTFPKDMR